MSEENKRCVNVEFKIEDKWLLDVIAILVRQDIEAHIEAKGGREIFLQEDGPVDWMCRIQPRGVLDKVHEVCRIFGISFFKEREGDDPYHKAPEMIANIMKHLLEACKFIIDTNYEGCQCMVCVVSAMDGKPSPECLAKAMAEGIRETNH